MLSATLISARINNSHNSGPVNEE